MEFYEPENITPICDNIRLPEEALWKSFYDLHTKTVLEIDLRWRLPQTLHLPLFHAQLLNLLNLEIDINLFIFRYLMTNIDATLWTFLFVLNSSVSQSKNFPRWAPIFHPLTDFGRRDTKNKSLKVHRHFSLFFSVRAEIWGRSQESFVFTQSYHSVPNRYKSEEKDAWLTGSRSFNQDVKLESADKEAGHGVVKRWHRLYLNFYRKKLQKLKITTLARKET